MAGYLRFESEFIDVTDDDTCKYNLKSTGIPYNLNVGSVRSTDSISGVRKEIGYFESSLSTF